MEAQWDENEPTLLVSKDIWEATDKGLLHEVRYWLKKKSWRIAKSGVNNYIFTPLFVAASKGDLEIVRCLWFNSILKYSQLNDSWKPLKWALFDKTGDLKKLKYRLPTGAEEYYRPINVNLRFMNPLLVAAVFGHLHIIEFFLNNGYTINIRGNKNETVLHIASLYNHMNVVDYLINKGAEVNCKDHENKTPLMYAVEEKRLNMVKKLRDYGADVNCVDNDLYTPLLVAIRWKDTELVKVLIDLGANVNYDGPVTPLALALDRNKPTEIVKMLINAGADLNHIDRFFKTPFEYAAKNADLAKVKLVLDRGAIVYLYGYPQPKYRDARMAIHDYRMFVERTEENITYGQKHGNTKKVCCLARDLLVLYWLIFYYNLPYDKKIILVKKRISNCYYYASFFKKLFLN